MPLELRVNPPVANEDLDRLYASAWPNHRSPWDFAPELERLLAYVCAYDNGDLVGFVKLAWDGLVHAFLLEPTVHPSRRHRGIGRRLVEHATEIAQSHHLEWLHVDYEPELTPFYRACGFEPTAAGLIRLDRWRRPASQPAPALETTRAIVTFLEPQLCEPLEAFRRRWDPLIERVPPHITLAFPFSAAIATADLVAHIGAAVRGVKPFDVVIAGITGMGEQYLFANIKLGNDTLIELHDRLYTGPLKAYLVRTQTFVPHVTVGRITDRRDFETALAEAADVQFTIRSTVRALSLSTLAAEGPLRITSNVALDG